MAKGNVGDRILVVDDDSIDGAYTNGHKGTICLVEEGFKGAYVDFDHLEKVRVGEYLYAEEYEIIQEASSATEEVIPWAVGQEVFCLLRGKGVVTEFDSDDKVYSVRVDFETGNTDWYTSEGKEESNYNRSLFFSAPQIIADKLPPKKPFIPSFKRGDQLLIIGNITYPGGRVFPVYNELEDKFIVSEAGMFFMKKDIRSVQLLGDKVEFNV